jgi:hypothetical protein
MIFLQISDKNSSREADKHRKDVHPRLKNCKKQKNRSHSEENGRTHLFHGAVLDIDDLFHD